MKVTRQMLDAGLRSYLTILKVLGLFFRYERLTKLLDVLNARSIGKDVEGLKCEEVYVPSSDGCYSIRVRIYRPPNSGGELPAMLYIHGGGYVMGNPEISSEFYREIINRRPCVIIAPAYRKAYTKPFPGALDDCYDTLLWLKDNAAALSIAPDRIMVAGHSAGGGLTAAVTHKARDTGDIDIAFQMPIYPMIDDRQPDDPDRAIDTFGWDTKANRVGWNAYLMDLQREGAEIPAYAAPARNSDYRGFPPTITFVGTLEPFYWETVAYAEALKEAEVDVAFEVYEGCYHAFEMMIPGADISRAAQAFLFENYASFYDKYVVAA